MAGGAAAVTDVSECDALVGLFRMAADDEEPTFMLEKQS
jgi:hypothetical protein